MLSAPAYLARIRYIGPTTPTPDTLRGIHRAHLLAVPFENLDIHQKRKISIDQNAFVRKIVEERRGGFCYELNGAFAALLSHLGFRLSMLSCRVARDNDAEGPDFDHLALLVECEGQWLADVGFGDSYLEPLRLDIGAEQSQDGRTFRIAQRGERLRVEKLEPSGSWKHQYSFGLAPHRLEEFAAMCHFHQTSPGSHFTHKRFCSIATADGRVTLAGMQLILTRNGKRDEIELASEQEWKQALRKYFGIVL
jgi:N-hydroxyarylamine O-acetyltransferase